MNASSFTPPSELKTAEDKTNLPTRVTDLPCWMSCSCSLSRGLPPVFAWDCSVDDFVFMLVISGGLSASQAFVCGLICDGAISK